MTSGNGKRDKRGTENTGAKKPAECEGNDSTICFCEGVHKNKSLGLSVIRPVETYGDFLYRKAMGLGPMAFVIYTLFLKIFFLTVKMGKRKIGMEERKRNAKNTER